jgi:hypothetical protein
MKKLTTILIVFLGFGFYSYSQNAQDALRFSQHYYGSTARSLSLSGAFGSLGGDFSSLSINPAGMGVYRKSEFTFTPSFGYNTALSTFNTAKLEDFNYDLGIGNIGLIGSFSTERDNGWKSFNIGFGYNKLNDFERVTAIKTIDANSSMLDQFENDINNGLEPTGTNLAIRSGLIYLMNENSNIWMSDITGTDYGQTLRHSVEENGYIGEYLFSAGANYEDMIYLGGSLGISSVRYNQITTHEEIDVEDNILQLNNFSYQQDLEISGSGVNFKAGVILKPVNWLRLGAAIHSPTFYNFHDTYSAAMESDLDSFSFEPQSASSEYDYELYTPPKFIGSASIILGKVALITADYERIDYSKAKLRGGGDGYTFAAENEGIQWIYDVSNNYRLGTEFRFGAISLRAGYAYFDSPYKSGELNQDADYQAISGGFGINNNSFYIDFGYSHYFGTEEYVLYQTPAAIASTDFVNNKLLCTVGFRF